MKSLMKICLLFVLYTNLQTFVLCGEDDTQSWSYIPGQNCPNHWPSMFATCAGERQSPIDIPTKDAKYDDNLNDINLIVIEDSDSMTLGNNGHSVYLTSDAVIHIEGGGLDDIYQVVGPHFHWGNESMKGSEHTFDGGKAYPLEMHIVTYNTEKYEDASKAIASGNGDALAVFGVLFRVGVEDNPRFQPIIENLNAVRETDSTVLIENIKLQSLLPKKTSLYYRYLGSLTTPECNEIVIWTLFEEKVHISEKQLQEFRKVLDKDGTPLVNNFRPTQELHNREILKSFEAPAYKIDQPSEGSSTDNSASNNKVYHVTILIYIITTIKMFF